MPRWLGLAIVALLLVGAGVGAAGYWGWQQINAPLDVPAAGTLFRVERGAALTRVTTDLNTQGILSHPHLIDLYARLTDQATAIHAGEYELQPGLTGVELLDKLVRGDVYLHQFTIVEGLRFADVLRRLRAHPAIAPTAHDGEAIMDLLGRPDQHPEGQLLPDTYTFPRGTTDVELLRWANDALWALIERTWDPAEPGVLTSPYEGLVLASIIEKETALDGERGLISGVLHERLRRGMRLQVDPTVIYGLGDAYQGNLTRAHLDADTPYNTYTRAGLPPTPIALAGAASIVAAFEPVETDALYFVATGEPDGSHVFSATLEEHNAAVQRYLERLRDNR